MYLGRQKSKMAAPWCIHPIQSFSLHVGDTCVYDGIVTLLITLHCVRFLVTAWRGLNIRNIVGGLEEENICVVNGLWGHVVKNWVASKSWEPLLANSQQENRHLIPAPTRNWILPTIWISFEEDPEFPKRTSMWPTLIIALWDLSLTGAQLSLAGLLTHGNCETIHIYCFKKPNLW